MWQICDGFQEDLSDVADVLKSVIELVELEESQVGFQVVADLLGLNIDVPLEGGDVVGVVPLDALEHVGQGRLNPVQRGHRHLVSLFDVQLRSKIK